MREEAKIFSDTIVKFLNKEFSGVLDAVDTFPETEVNWRLYENIFKFAPCDDVFTLSDSVEILLKISTICAGISSIFAGQFALNKLSSSSQFNLSEPVALAFIDEGTRINKNEVSFSCILKDDHLFGEKRMVMGASVVDKAIVFVKSEKGVKCLLTYVKKKGVDVHPERTLGLRTSLPYRLIFNGVEPDRVFDIDTEQLINFAIIYDLLLFASSLGTAGTALDRAKEYALERYQGGNIIYNYGAVKALYIKNWIAVNNGIDMIKREAGKMDEGIRITPEEWAMLREFLRMKPVKAGLDAIQILGGYGYIRDYGIEKRFRDATSLVMLLENMWER